MNALRWAAVALVILAPLPLGSNHPETWSLLSLLIGILLLTGCGLIWRDADALSIQHRLIIPLAIFTAIVCFIILQTVDVGPRLGNPIWQEINAVTGRPVANTISVNPGDTMTALMRLLAYAGVFWLAFSMAHDGTRAWQHIRYFAYASLAFAVYGVIVYFAGNETILWFEKWAYFGDLTSTFVNRNSYATFAGMGFLAAAACVLRELSHLKITRVKDLTETPPRRLKRFYVLSLTLLITATALFLTHSRGGFSATLAGSVLFIVGAVALQRGQKLMAIAAALLFLGIVAFTLTISGDLTMERLFATRLDSSTRDDVYLLVLEGINASPMIGWGYGTFEEAFRPFYSYRIGFANWSMAHNTYLETAFELGWPTAILFFSIFLVFAVTLISGIYKRRRQRLLPMLGLSLLLLSGLHAIVDFSHQIPAVAVSFAWLIGTCIAQSYSSANAGSRAH